MLRGDISNRESPIIAFNIDTLLFKHEQKKDSLKDKFIGVFGSEKSKAFNRVIDDVFVNNLLYLWHNFNYSIYLVTYNSDYISEYEKLLADKDICYTRLVDFSTEDLDGLRRFVANRCTLYFDSDLVRLSTISNTKAVEYRNLWTYMRRK